MRNLKGHCHWNYVGSERFCGYKLLQWLTIEQKWSHRVGDSKAQLVSLSLWEEPPPLDPVLPASGKLPSAKRKLAPTQPLVYRITLPKRKFCLELNSTFKKMLFFDSSSTLVTIYSHSVAFPLNQPLQCLKSAIIYFLQPFSFLDITYLVPSPISPSTPFTVHVVSENQWCCLLMTLQFINIPFNLYHQKKTIIKHTCAISINSIKSPDLL